MGAHWMYKGESVLIVYDDLSKQAQAYRQLSLLMRRPPGREAYPGDIFYCHSRLLERAAKLSDELGGGSLTALPIVETLEGRSVGLHPHQRDLPSPTARFISSPILFFAGHAPGHERGHFGIASGRGGPVPAMKKVAGGLRLDLASFRELEAFAQLGTDLDKASQQQLARGARVIEVLKQPQYRPASTSSDQVRHVYAATGGRPRRLPRRGREAVRGRARRSILDTREPGGPVGTIRDSGDLPGRRRSHAQGRARGFPRPRSRHRRSVMNALGATTPPDEAKPRRLVRMSSVEEGRAGGGRCHRARRHADRRLFQSPWAPNSALFGAGSVGPIDQRKASRAPWRTDRSSLIVKVQQRVERRPYAVQLTKAMDDLAQRGRVLQRPPPRGTGGTIEGRRRRGHVRPGGLAGADANAPNNAQELLADARRRGLSPCCTWWGRRASATSGSVACPCAPRGGFSECRRSRRPRRSGSSTILLLAAHEDRRLLPAPTRTSARPSRSARHPPAVC